jgi:hypothetical protein
MTGMRNTLSPAELRAEGEGTQGEGEYLYDGLSFDVATGFNIFDVQTDRRASPDLGLIATGGRSSAPISDSFPTNQETVYAYSNIQFPRELTWTIGLSYDDYKRENIHLQKVNPKFGLQ